MFRGIFGYHEVKRFVQLGVERMEALFKALGRGVLSVGFEELIVEIGVLFFRMVEGFACGVCFLFCFWSLGAWGG